jgi:hypothetical protein
MCTGLFCGLHAAFVFYSDNFVRERNWLLSAVAMKRRAFVYYGSEK